MLESESVVGGSNPEPTVIQGIISENRTLSLEGSPYEVQVQIASGVTLTIEPGVKVDGLIDAFGDLEAMGTPEQRITMRVSLSSAVANGSNSSVVLEFVDMTGGSRLNWGQGDFRRLIFRDSRFCNIGGTFQPWFNREPSFIERSIFAGAATVIEFHVKKMIFRNNVFASNSVILPKIAGELPIIHHNSFLGGRIQMPEGSGSTTLDATDNYWGSTDPALIARKIHDQRAHLAASGVVEFEPFLTAPHADTPGYVPGEWCPAE